MSGRDTNVFRPISVASPWGCTRDTWTARDLQPLYLQRGTVLQVTPGGNIPGSCAIGCKGADPYNRAWAMLIPDSVYPYFPTPAHTEHTMLCLSAGLIFLLILLHLKQFWFPGLPEWTELTNESSCEPVKSQEGSWLG